MNDTRTIWNAMEVPGWLRGGLFVYAGAMLLVALVQGWEWCHSVVVLSSVGPNRGAVLALLEETAGLSGEAARELLKSIDSAEDSPRGLDGRRERPATVVVAKSLSFSQARATALRYQDAKASAEAVRGNWSSAPLTIWGAMNFLAAATMITALRSWHSPTRKHAYLPPPVRLTVLTVGGILGLSTLFCLTVVPLFGLVGNDAWRVLIANEGRAAWKTWAGWKPLVLGYAAMVVMFLSVLAIRSEERANATLRRLLYGCNTVLNGLLLLSLLVLVNVLTALYGVYYSGSFADWTAGHVYSISDGSRSILRELKQPVRFFVIFNAGDPERSDLEKLLENFKGVNPDMIDYEFLSPSSRDRLELLAIRELNRKYPWPLTDPAEPNQVARGVLVVTTGASGTADQEQEEFDFIKRFPDLYDRGQEGGRAFKGEQALISAVVNLTSARQVSVVVDDVGLNRERVIQTVREATALGRGEVEQLLEDPPSVVQEDLTRRQARELVDKLTAAGARASIGSRRTIYVTQSHGEPDLAESRINPSPFGNVGLGLFKQRLEEAGYTVKPLTLRGTRAEQPPRVPRDAAIVVVAGPEKLDMLQVNALREYMKDPKHRMLLLLEPVLTDQGQLQKVGIEDFLEEFGVETLVRDPRTDARRPDIILNGRPRDERGQVVVEANDVVVSANRDRQLLAPLARYANRSLDDFYTIRTVRPKSDGDPRFRVTPLLETERLQTESGQRVHLQWSEIDLVDFERDLRERRYVAVQSRLTRGEGLRGPAIPVGVTVRRGRPDAGFDPHSPNAEGDPCMVVIGDVTLATNVQMAQRTPDGRSFVRSDRFYDILSGCLAWLRDRPEQIAAIKVQTRTDYTLTDTTARQIESIRIYPGLLLISVIVLGGVGVSLMRKR